ncbi:hypothetical protein AA0120_g1534 [Alternaria tenuissima]|nr:hypothetical protein AA0120_g1534 [Alternaria tenuissima]
MTSYQYSALSPGSIRVLAVSGTKDAPSYKIEVLNLADKPRFEALSYTWNDYDNEEPRAIDGNANTYASIPIAGAGSLKITLHLVHILNHIHGLLVQPGSSGRIWIDQIAVNQRDLDERSHQVALMQQIYGQAERTLMWIGKSVNHTPVLLDLIQNLRGISLDVDWDRPAMKRLESRLLAIFRQEDELRYSYTKVEYMKAVDWVLGLPYFERAWIVQEIVLSTQPTLVLGSTPFHLYILHHTIFIIRYSADPYLQDVYSELKHTIGVDRFLSIDTARRWLRGDPKYKALYGDFLDVLFWLSSLREASDPRDSIYAFLALQKDDSGSRAVANYNLSIAQAYRKFCIDIASQTGSLPFLGLVRGSADAEIPSWVIDWRMGPFSAKDKWQGYRIGDPQKFPYAAAKERLYQAARNTHEDDMRLVVRGRVIDSVQFVSCVTREELANSGLENVRLAEEMSNIRTSMPTVDIDTPAKAQLAKTRVFAILVGLDPGQQPLGESLQYTPEELTSMYEHYIDTHSADDIGEELYKQRFNHTNLRLEHKRLFLGRKQLFGIGPNAILPGDCICIVHGSTVPLILRRCENETEYTVVGQCYYENWMHGELVDWGEDEADEFVLI